MKIDLKKMNSAQLKDLAKDVEDQLKTIQKQALSNAVTEVRAVANSHGVALEDILAHLTGGKRKPKIKSVAKYRNPDDPTQTWTGRGRKPQWVAAALHGGKDIADLEI